MYPFFRSIWSRNRHGGAKCSIPKRYSKENCTKYVIGEKLQHQLIYGFLSAFFSLIASFKWWCFGFCSKVSSWIYRGRYGFLDALRVRRHFVNSHYWAVLNNPSHRFFLNINKIAVNLSHWPHGSKPYF